MTWRAPTGEMARVALGRGLVAARDATPGRMAVVVTVMGLAWLLLELALRGDRATVVPDWTLLIAAASLAVVVGLAARARMTMRGELAVARDLAVVLLLVISLFPALMLVVYAVAMATSAGVVSLSWALWGVTVVLAVVVQLAIFAACVGLAMATFKEGIAMLFLAGIFAAVVSVVANKVTGDPADAWNFAVFRWAQGRAALIPEWTFAFQALREAVAPLDHRRLMSALSSVAGGTAAGLVISALLRLGRQRLMARAAWRPWLPMAAAPVPDASPLLDGRILRPLVVYALVTWSAVLTWKVL
jgi:hypothetical protein